MDDAQWIEKRATELAAHVDAIVERWNEEHSDRQIAIERGGDVLGKCPPARMYRFQDRILTLRFFSAGAEYKRLRQGPIVAGGSLGFRMADRGLNLVLVQEADRRGSAWLLVEVSDNPLAGGGRRTRILANDEADLARFSQYLENVAASLQVQARPFSDDACLALVGELAAT